MLIISLLFSVNIYAQQAETLDVQNDNLEKLDLSQEKAFSQSAREKLLGIASKFDTDKTENLSDFAFQNEDIDLKELNFKQSQNLSLFKDLNLNANYSKQNNKNLETAADFQLEYALNPKTFIRAGYSVSNEEWNQLKSSKSLADNNDSDDQDSEDSLNPGSETEAANFTNVYQNELESSHRMGLAYKTNERLTISADYIENNEFGSYYDEIWDLAGDSTVVGLKYSYPEGAFISARYQVDNGDDATQKITGVDFAFNNLATFSASYKLLNPEELEDNLFKQKTAWDLGLGLNLTEDYGLALGYELIETKDQPESEKKIKASFEINF